MFATSLKFLGQPIRASAQRSTSPAAFSAGPLVLLYITVGVVAPFALPLKSSLSGSQPQNGHIQHGNCQHAN